MSEPDLKAKLKVKLRASWQPEQLSAHKLNLVSDSLITMKQKILRKLKLPKENPANFHFSITFSNFPFLLTNEEDLYFFLSQFISESSLDPLIISITPIKVTKKALLARESLTSSGDKPSDPIYSGETEVFCAFCKGSSLKDDEYINDLGSFYGPFKSEGKDYFCHERCAIWSPDVYLDMDNRLKNIGKEIKRARKCLCNYCGTSGAGLGCLVKNCRKTYHFKCSLQEDLDCLLDCKAFTLYCSEHKDQAPQGLEREELVYEKIFCNRCGSGDDDEKLVICEGCFQSCHVYCMREKMEEVPEEDWFCDACVAGNNNEGGFEEKEFKVY